MGTWVRNQASLSWAHHTHENCGLWGYLQAQSLPGKPGRLLWHQEDPAPNHHQGVNSCTVLSEAESEKISHNLARENFSLKDYLSAVFLLHFTPMCWGICGDEAFSGPWRPARSSWLRGFPEWPAGGTAGPVAAQQGCSGSQAWTCLSGEEKPGSWGKCQAPRLPGPE